MLFDFLHIKRPRYLCFFVTLSLAILSSVGQNRDLQESSGSFFSDPSVLKVSLNCSKKAIRRETNDSTYINSKLSYKISESDWDTLDIKLRARGNFRKATCSFTPLKLKIKKSERRGTIFENQKSLKLVMPCLNEKGMNDNILKEYLIYKMYEIISPIAFNTRLIDLSYAEVRGKKTRDFEFRGFFVEDDVKMAERLDARVAKRRIFPQGFDDKFAVRNAIFNFMIGNTDFSTTNNHNCKAIYIDKKFVPVSYDFDLAGFVNTSYAVVSKTRRKSLPIEKVTQRYYMGYKRDYSTFLEVRQEFLNKQKDLFSILEAHKSMFASKKAFDEAKTYLQEFYTLLLNEKKYKQLTYDKALPLN